MKAKLQKKISIVREFNRYYTNFLGLLNQHILDSPFSLSEVRILYEIAETENCTAKTLSETLMLDPGYLSRILKSFQKNGLIERYKSPADGRAQYLILSETGCEKIHELNAKSDEQIAGIMNGLSKGQKEELVYCMKKIEQILEVKQDAE